jgi:hypothetical protein
MYAKSAWAEDKARRERDLSADPRPRPEGRQEAAQTGFGIGSKAIHPFTVFLLSRLPYRAMPFVRSTLNQFRMRSGCGSTSASKKSWTVDKAS